MKSAFTVAVALFAEAGLAAPPAMTQSGVSSPAKLP